VKKTFPGYYRPTDDEFSELWENCLQQAAAYGKIQDSLSAAQNRLENDLRSQLRQGRHPFIAVERLLERVRNAFSETAEQLDKSKQEHPDFLDDDPVRDTITTLLEGKVGSPYPPERLHEIFKEGKTRYEQKIPPGYEDAIKGGVKQYGDLILWFQVIDKAKETKASIILVNDDRKDDWWLRFKGRTIGPQPELVEEIVSKAGVSFYMYAADPFMEHARNYLDRQIKQEAIDEVRDGRKQDEERLAKEVVARIYAGLEGPVRLARQYEEYMRPSLEMAAHLAKQYEPSLEMAARLAKQYEEYMRPNLEMAAHLAKQYEPSLEALARLARQYEEYMRPSLEMAARLAKQYEEYLRPSLAMSARLAKQYADLLAEQPASQISEKTVTGAVSSDAETEEKPDKSDEQPDTENE
jgi:hypothetical protein